MQHNILIIDDEWSQRKSLYEELSEKITNEYQGFHIVFDYLKEGNRSALLAMLHRNQYTAVITDAILNGAWLDFTIRDVVELIDNETPMAVVSGKWGSDNIGAVRLAWLKPNCRTFLHWRDIQGEGDIGYAIESIIHMVADKERLDTHLRLDSSEELRIVHISDVHATYNDSEKEDDVLNRIKNQAQGCARVIREHWSGNSPAFIAFTGDVTEYGSPMQYVLAEKWIKYFCGQLDFGQLPSRQLLYVPGNHDVNLRLAAAARIELNIDGDNINPNIKDDEQQPELVTYASVPFRNYLANIADCPLLFNNIDAKQFAWMETRFRHLGVIFYGVNTSEPSSTTLPKRKIDLGVIGCLGDKLGEILNDHSGCFSESHPIVIGLGHHSPLPVDETDGEIENTREMKKFFQNAGKTHIFLHGHCHEARIEDHPLNQSKIIMSGAPSFDQCSSKRPEDTFRGFNLLTFARKNNKLEKLKVDSFGWVGTNLKLLDSQSYTLQDNSFLLS